MQYTRPGLSGIFIRLAVFFSVGACGLQAGAITHQVSLPSNMSWCADSMIDSLLSTINTFRATQGIFALQTSALGMKDADMRAVQFAQYMATNSPSTPGFNPHQGYDTTAYGLGYNLIDENLAYLTNDPNYIVNTVWQDPAHLASLLASDANVAGVYCAYSNGVPFWTYEPGFDSSVSAGQPPATSPPASGGSTSSPSALDSEESSFVSLVNAYRAANGAGPLSLSATLEGSAQWMSTDLATHNYFSHTDSLGRSTGPRLAALGYTYSPWGEDIAAGYADAQSTLVQWETACDPDASGTCTYAHRQNLLNKNFVALGIARSYNASSAYGWYWVADFGGVLDKPFSPGPTQSGPPVISSFSASPAIINVGGTATLTWNVSGATAIAISNGPGSVTGTTTYTVKPAQTTTYQLTATGSGGTKTASVTVTVVPAQQDTQAPSAPTQLFGALNGNSSASLSWNPSTDNVGVAGYQVVRNGLVVAKTSGGTTSYLDSGLTGSAKYTYLVRAYDAAGNVSGASNTVQLSVAPPPTTSTVCPAPALGVFTGCYYNNTSLQGSPVLVRTDAQVSFDWLGAIPGPGLGSRGFSALWQGYFNFQPANYTFTAIASDGIRISVDGTLILDDWRDQAASTFTVGRLMSAGSHLIAIDYYDASGLAAAHVSWAPDRTSR